MIDFLSQHQFWAAVGVYWIFSAAVSALTGLKVVVPLLVVKTRSLMVVFLIASFLVVTPVTWTEFSADEGKQLGLRYQSMHLSVRYLISDAKILYDSADNLVGKWNSDGTGNMGVCDSRYRHIAGDDRRTLG